MKKVVILTGAGISQESGIKTFRDTDGMWGEYNIMDVAHVKALSNNLKNCLDFYNKRRLELDTVVPNEAHFNLVNLEEEYDVTIITQNVDDLHERAGSTNVLHLHGELKKQKAIGSEELSDYNLPIEEGHVDEEGRQLRPHIVMFGEGVPNMEKAYHIVSDCDYFVIIGTSLEVYPAALLLNFVDPKAKWIVINPVQEDEPGVMQIKEKATIGTRKLKDILNNMSSE